MLTDDELIKAIESGESVSVEFTESAKDSDKIRKAICAFANNLPQQKSPGLMFIGINDKGGCADKLKVTNQLLEQLSILDRDGKTLPFPSIEVDKRILKGCEVAVVQVAESDNPPVKVGGRCWIRVGPTSAQATPEQERLLTEKRRWGNVPPDMHGVRGSAVAEDLDMRKFDEYLLNAVSPEVLAENNRDRPQQMQALRLITRDGIPTMTAIFMLGKEPSYWFPGAYIQFIRSAGNEITGAIMDQKTIHGTLPDQLHKIDEIIKATNPVAMNTEGTVHIEQRDYPYVALRELIRNAVIHRDYEGTHAPVRIHWFMDRIEIISPGGLYGAVKRDTFGTSVITDYRNPTIAEAMKNMGFMEKFGSGIATARQALTENGNPAPEFEAQDMVTLVKVKKRL